MKKIFAFCLAAVMLLSLAACGQDVPENDEAGSNPSQQVGAPSASVSGVPMAFSGTPFEFMLCASFQFGSALGSSGMSL